MIISCMLYVCTSCAIDKSLILQSNIASHNTHMGAQEDKQDKPSYSCPSFLSCTIMGGGGGGGGGTYSLKMKAT